MAATANPWGVDENKYYINVGGLQSFLSLADNLEGQQNEEYTKLMSVKSQNIGINKGAIHTFAGRDHFSVVSVPQGLA
ncbi:hypothetical protein FGO68_gene17692 [Halteria grandinella]|uniref:Uncharacterized protein n=1 Tax=Halteria grandinella TaxID=5974 RepID=A0A8J8NI21_HALGN|nr:hypothetical protein FGO68_gene17692 [Halteria grandinella]